MGGRHCRRIGTDLRRATDDLVVDVGDVLHVCHSVPTATQIAGNQVELDIGLGVPEVAEVVNGRTAHEHAHRTRDRRLEQLFAFRERVVNDHANPLPSLRSVRRNLAASR